MHDDIYRPAKRQEQNGGGGNSDGGRAGSASEGSFDSRWFLLLIPIILLFFALLAVVWCMIRRRRKRRQRRSTLRNVTLVVAHAEKERERQLSRGNSLVSRISSSRSKTGREGYRTARRKAAAAAAGDVDGHHRTESGSSNTHGTSSGGHKDVYVIEAKERLEPTLEDDSNIDLELGQRDDTQGGVHAGATHRKELSVIGEAKTSDEEVPTAERGLGMATASHAASEVPAKTTTTTAKTTTQRQDSTESSAAPTSAVSFKDPFVTPTATSSGHGQTYLDTPITSPVSQQSHAKGEEEAGAATTGGLVRRLSDVVRLRQPSPGAQRHRPLSPNPPLSRSASHQSKTDNYKRAKQASAKVSKTSLKSTSSIDTASISSPKRLQADLPGADARSPPLPAGAWTYISKEQEWNTSSSAVGHNRADEVAATSEEVQAAPSSAAEVGQGHPPPPPIPAEGEAPLSPSSTGLGRKPSIGVAGSRFKETFDD